MSFVTFLNQHQVILLFLIITLGYLIGRIRIFNFSLETSGILFVAMFFGKYGFTLNHGFQVLGIVFFIYAIGLQAGPSIFNISGKHSLHINSLVFFLLAMGALFTVFFSRFWHIDMKLAVGLFSGAMTSTPGLAAAQEATKSALTSTGYGVAYPFGVIGVIFFIKLMPGLFRVKIKDEEQSVQKAEEEKKEEVVIANVLITNEQLEGKTLQELDFNRITGTVISRIFHADQFIIPSDDSVVHVNDIVRIVGQKSKIKAAIPFLGKKTTRKIPEVQNFESRKFVVTNKEIIGKKVSDLNLRTLYGANITRIRRGGVEFAAEPDQFLRWGDRLRVAGDAAHMEDIGRLLGNEMKRLEYGNIFSVILGILIGIGIGLIPFSIGAISFRLGLTGGVLLSGIILSNRGKFGPVIWLIPAPIINFMREVGLVLFLAVVGVRAGSQIFSTIQHQGFKLIIAGAIITLVPMIVIALIARLKYRFLLIELFGMISGGMTSTPGLAAGTSMTESQVPLVMYATVYPFAMLLMMIWAKILVLF